MGEDGMGGHGSKTQNKMGGVKMATQKEVATALEVIPEAQSLVEIVRQAAKEVKLNPVHLVRVAATAIRLNPKLARCTPASFVGSLIVLEQVGLEPVAGRAYLLPFMNNRKLIINGKEEWRKQLEVQALIGYKGYSDLFYRHESALTIEAHEVHQNDKFDFEYGTNSFLRHKPAEGDRGPTVKYYCIAKMKDGAVLFLVMSKEECIEHGKKHSKVYDKKTGDFMPGTPWKDDADAMCKKTCLLQLSKNLPLSIETQKALSVDETSREYRPGIGSALDLPDTTTWEEPPIETGATLENKKEEVTPEKKKLGSESEPAKTPLSPEIKQQLVKARTKVGDKAFYEVLGGMGCETIDEIQTIADVNKLIAELGKVYANQQGK